MPKQIRIYISDEAAEALKDACAERRANQGEVVTEALVAFLNPEQQATTQIEALMETTRMIYQLLQRLIEVNGWSLDVEASHKADAEQPPEDSLAAYRALYGKQFAASMETNEPGDMSEEPVTEQASQHGFVRRLFFKG
jgi:hypothetical protein